ncbi:G-protein coupled receptor 157-like [Saccostrea echinata]|uniref:G-protein coupled receptor 157-like n=1 Tax=Saccostrea echinata TaxID=191078 RepID=UPI002A82A1E6|nr:G-protein coupled receptor 157-like [Saccostrea echinata]
MDSSTKDAFLAAITLLSASLSLTGGFALLLTYYKIPEFQNSVRKLLVFLTIADIFTALGYIIGTVNFLRLDAQQRNSTDSLCIAQSFITTFSSLSSFAWTSIIAVHLYVLIRTQRDFQRNRSLKILYHFSGWAIPAIICIPVLAEDKLGRDHHGQKTGTGLWCWIKINNTDGKIHSRDIVLMFMTGKFWELLTYVLSFSIYMILKINTYIERQKDKSYSWRDVGGENLRNEDERFCFTWLILYLLRFWGTMRFFIEISKTESDKADAVDDILKYFHCAGDSAQALGNFILFCLLDKNIRGKYHEMIGYCCNRHERNDLLKTPFPDSGNYQSIPQS